MIKYFVAMATLVVALFTQAETQLAVNKTKVQDVQWYSHNWGMLYYTDTTSSSVNKGDAGIYKVTN